MTSRTGAIAERTFSDIQLGSLQRGRFIRFVRSQPLGAFGIVLSLALLGSVFLGPYLTTHDPNAISTDLLVSPSSGYWFGTDNFGRDNYSRVISGGRTTISVSVGAILIGTFVSALLGMVSAYFGRWVDLVIQRLVDALLALPGLVLVMFFVSVFGRSTLALVLVVSLAVSPGLTRVVRGSSLAALSQTYIESAVASGASGRRILVRHVLPNIAPTIGVVVTTGVGSLMLVTSGLGFLGLGVQPPTAEWGRLLAEARPYAVRAPWLAIFPGLMISTAVLGVNLAGDALRDIWDPRLRN